MERQKWVYNWLHINTGIQGTRLTKEEMFYWEFQELLSKWNVEGASVWGYSEVHDDGVQDAD